jgi:hypothetical protein
MANKFIIEGTVGADDLSVEDGGAARIATVEPDGDDGNESGIFVRVQSWDEEFCNGETPVPSHPDFEKLFGKVIGRRFTAEGKKRVRITIEILEE